VNPVQRAFARRLFEKWKIDPASAETLIDSIVDWIDADDRPRPHGAENDYYRPLGNPQFPFNRPFDDLDDLLLVRGAEELDFAKPTGATFSRCMVTAPSTFIAHPRACSKRFSM
jgi:type II secretory pathway component PulK